MSKEPKDRNKSARESLEQQDLQTKRRFIDLNEGISNMEEAIRINESYVEELNKKVNTLKGDEKHQVVLKVYDTKATVKKQKKDMLYAKEDIFYLLKGRNAELFKDNIKKHYEDVEVYFKSNFAED